MHAAYLNQTINLMVSILLVPVLLRYLDVNDYILWSIFTTLGAITLQFESAIQNASIRDIAREFHSENRAALSAAIRRTRLAYRTLAGVVFLPVGAAGLLYLDRVASVSLGKHAYTEWMLFVAAYTTNYLFGANNSILLGMGRVERFNNTTSLTRVLNFLLTYLLLRSGLSIMGVCVSFGCSVAAGCTMMATAARRLLRECEAHGPDWAVDGPPQRVDVSNIVRYVLYSTASFALYRGGLLVATRVLPKAVVADYSLLLQAYGILSLLALVPLQVWLRRLTSAIASGNRAAIRRELAVSIVAANAIFIAGSAALVWLGNPLLAMIGSKVTLSSDGNVVLLGFAFLIELNIAVLVNFLVTANNYGFLRTYLTTSIAGIVCMIALPIALPGSVIALVAVPLGLQGLVCLPLIWRRACKGLDVTPSSLLSELGKFIMSRA